MEKTIKVSSNVKLMLDKLKVHHRESYNELLQRLITSFKEEKESLVDTLEIMSDPDLMRSLAQGMEDYNKGKFKTLEQYILKHER